MICNSSDIGQNSPGGKVTSPEMRIFDSEGRRLYLNEDERQRYLVAAREESREDQVFCHLLHYTGCRPSEALAVTALHIDLIQYAVTLRSLKKRKLDYQGRIKKPVFRVVPVPGRMIEDLALVFDLRNRQKSQAESGILLWPMSRQTAWRMVKRVMDRAGISGPQATSKGLRHGFGAACVIAGVPLHKVRDWLGHADTKTTEIYTTLVNEEERAMMDRVWR